MEEPVLQTGEGKSKPLTPHIASLDGLRCFAVMQVLLNHYVTDTRPSESMPVVVASNLFQFFGNGVQLFFVLSGFLITGILLRAKGSESYFRTFYIRRTLRIFPLYYGVLIAVFGTLAVMRANGTPLSEDAERAFRGQGWLWSYLTNFGLGAFEYKPDFWPLRFGHFWTLSVEEQFYLVWPLLVFFLSARSIARICVAAFVLIFLGRVYFHSIGAEQVNFYLLSNDGLFVGAFLAAVVSVHNPAPTLASRSFKLFLVFAVIFLGMITAGFANRANVLPGVVGSIAAHLPPLMMSVQCLMFASLLIWIVTAPASSIWRRICETGPATYIGRISYGIYVYHVLLLGVFRYVSEHVVKAIHAPPLVGWVLEVGILVALAIIVASLSWHLFEQPILRLKDRFAYEPKRAGTKRPADAPRAV